MRVIYKYPILKWGASFEVELPQVAQIIHVGLDPNDVPCLWAMIDTTDTGRLKYTLQVVGTGQPFPMSARWIGTFRDGRFMWHLFEMEAPVLVP